MKKNKKVKNNFFFLKENKFVNASWFGLPIIISKQLDRKKIIKNLEINGVETRPIISGNFLKQPSVSLYKLDNKKYNLTGAEEIERRGFFIGIHTKKISNKELNYLEKKLLSIDKIQ